MNSLTLPVSRHLQRVNDDYMKAMQSDDPVGALREFVRRWNRPVHRISRDLKKTPVLQNSVDPARVELVKLLAREARTKARKWRHWCEILEGKTIAA